MMGKTTAGVGLALLVLLAPALADEEGENLVGNPGFEDGIEGWDERGEPIVLDETERFTGKSACKSVGHQDLEHPSFHWVKSADIPAERNRSYDFSLMVKASFTDGVLAPSVREVDENGKTAGYHAAEALGPGEYDWHRASVHFNTSGRAHHFQVYLIMRNVIGTAWYDDVKLVRLQPEPLPKIGEGKAVTFPGSVGELEMRIEAVRALEIYPPIFHVQTTGALYRIDGAGGLITGSQRIGVERQAVSIRLEPAPGELKPLRSDESVCVLGNENIEIGVQCDSLIVIAPGQPTKITIEGLIEGKYTANEGGNVQVIDEHGGVGIYPHVPPGSGLVADLEQEPGDLSKPRWQCEYELHEGALIGVSIFPPREFDFEKSFEWQLAHTGGYPADTALETWSKYVKLVCLHESIWAGGSPISHTGPYELQSEDDFRRCVATCERLGMKLIPYMSAYYYYRPGIDDFLEQVAEKREKYGFHGIYYDGIYFRDWVKSYKLMRRTREMFPEGPIYVHTSWGPPVGTQTIWCPFIDTYADIVLRGESHVTEGRDDPYVRYVAGGYRLSNAIGLMKGNKWDIPAEEQLEVMLDYNGRARMGTYPGKDAEGNYRWPGEDGTLENPWTQYYFPRLKEMEKAWLAGELGL